MRERLNLRLEKGDSGGRRAYVVAIIVNILVLLLISSIVTVPMIYLMPASKGTRVVPEHVTYIETHPKPKPLPPDTGSKPPAARPKGEPVPPSPVPPAVTPPAVTPPVSPPAEIPVGVNPPKVAGDTGARRGAVHPGFGPGVLDPRLLGAMNPPPPPTPPMRIPYPSTDSAVRSWVHSYWDSVAHVQASAGKGNDWTVDRNGKKYGLDPQFIYFGKFKLPTMLLALLPIYTQANPTAAERNRALESMRSDILFQAMRAQNENAFRDAVNELRARKDAEHKAQEAAKKPPPN